MTKVCNRCKLEKDLTEFGFDKVRKDGKQVYCKQCKRELRKEIYQKNKVINSIKEDAEKDNIIVSLKEEINQLKVKSLEIKVNWLEDIVQKEIEKILHNNTLDHSFWFNYYNQRLSCVEYTVKGKLNYYIIDYEKKIGYYSDKMSTKDLYKMICSDDEN